MTDIVSSTYLGYLRSGHPHVVRANLSLIMPNTIYCGTVASEPDRGARTLTVTNVSGNIANVVAGMTVWIGAACGSFSKAKRRLRGRSGQVLTIDENPTDIALGDYVTVVDSREFWSIWPYVTETPPYTFYKDRDIAYSDQNLYPSPVAIAGPYRVGRLNTTTGLLTFALNASSSYAMAYGATISSYLWTCTGGTIASSTSAITSITFDTAGVYWLSLTVTDSNGKSHTTWRAYRVHDANDPAYTQFNVTSPLAQDWMSGGWRASLSLSDAYSLTDYPDGALALIWVDQTFNGVEAYYEDNVRFCGHFRRSTLREGLGSGEMAFDLETMDGLMTNRNMMSASLEYSTSPKTWYQMYRLTVARAIHHYLRWHTTIFDITDVYLPTDETTPLPAVDDFENGDIYGQLDNFAYNRSIFAKPLFDRHNRLWVKRDIHILGTADRAAVPNLVTLSLTDLQPTLEITVNGEPTVCHLVVSGGVRNSVDNTMTPIISQAPGEVPENEGATERPFDFQVIPTQEAANVLAGRAYAIVNRYLEEIRIKLAGNYGDIFECSPQYWVTLPALPNDRGLDLAGKYSVKAISVPLELTTGTAGCELVLVPDIASVDGIPGPYPPDVEEGNGGEEPPESPPWTPPAPPPPIDTTDISDIFVAIQDDVRSCNDMEGASISWVSKANGITGTIVDACTYYNDGTKNNACAATETKV